MPPGRYILALDQGTSGSTALVVDADGVVRARGHAELTQYYPQPGWVEHDPEEIWTTMGEAARRAMAEARVTGADIAAVGITNQRETTIVWERATGSPIHRAIVWQCRRTAAMCDALKASGAEALVRERTGLVLDAYFSGTKIAWLLDHVRWARRRANRWKSSIASWMRPPGRASLSSGWREARSRRFAPAPACVFPGRPSSIHATSCWRSPIALRCVADGFSR
jgi:glycerol kinase